jgi:hypothetical protein
MGRAAFATGECHFGHGLSFSSGLGIKTAADKESQKMLKVAV